MSTLTFVRNHFLVFFFSVAYFKGSYVVFMTFLNEYKKIVYKQNHLMRIERIEYSDLYVFFYCSLKSIHVYATNVSICV